MADFQLPGGEWIRLQDAVEFWASHVKQRDVLTPSQGPSDPTPVFANDAWSDYPAIKADPTLTAAATDFNIRLIRAACSGRVLFKGKRETGDAVDYVRIPSEYFVTPLNFISETGDISPLLSGANEEEEILAYAMSNEPVAWCDVLVHRDEFLKWFKDEFPDLYRSHVDQGLLEASVAASDTTAFDIVIKKRLQNGDVPGSTIKWKQFCDELRNECDGWTDVKKAKPKRGYGDKSIQRIVNAIRRKEA